VIAARRLFPEHSERATTPAPTRLTRAKREDRKENLRQHAHATAEGGFAATGSVAFMSAAMHAALRVVIPAQRGLEGEAAAARKPARHGTHAHARLSP